MCDYFIDETEEYCFDRNARYFETVVLGYYQSGFVCMENVCVHQALSEMRFWRIGFHHVRTCCATNTAVKVLSEYTARHRNDECVRPRDDEEIDRLYFGVNRGDFDGLCCGNARRVVHRIVEVPTSSKYALAFTILSLACVFTSVVALVLSTLPELESPSSRKTLQIIEAVCVSWFTVEYLLRLFSAPKRLHFLIQPISLIDVLAILPFYVQLVMQQFHVPEQVVLWHQQMLTMRTIRALMIFRALRILKVARYSAGLKSMGLTLRRSAPELALLILFILATVLIFATAVYFVECETEDTQFTSIPAAMWWCITTITTIGYGDIYPKTALGKCIAAVVSIFGVVFLAFPVSIIVDNFGTSYFELTSDETSTRPTTESRRASMASLALHGTRCAQNDNNSNAIEMPLILVK